MRYRFRFNKRIETVDKTTTIPKWRYRLFKYGFIVSLLLLIVCVLVNYNYMTFKLLVGGNYIFTDALDVLYKETLGEENLKGYMWNFDHFVVSAVTEKIRSVNDDRYTYLYTPQNYQLSKDVEKADAASARIEELTPDIIYMILPNVSKGTKDFVLENKDVLKNYKNLILDLRSNYGGMLMDFYTIAELFTERGEVLGYEKTRIPFLTHSVKSGNGKFFDFKQIYILQDGNTASAAEGMILALKDNVDNVTTMG
ncbi:MAG: hypothetical protein LBQ68_00125, partial [Clostridiales bacterium]|nr:hypothetical protein [Clostridiales bacterium]